MSIKLLEQTLQPAWNQKSAAEKLITKALAGLSAIAAGNSGVQWSMSALGTPPTPDFL